MTTVRRIRIPALALAAMAFVAGVTLIGAPAAHAQAVKFLQPGIDWVSPSSTSGAHIKDNQIWVDVDMDGTDSGGDSQHDIPTNIDATWTFNLSPTLTIMTAKRHNGGGCPNGGTTDIRVFAIPPGNDPLIELGSQQSLNTCLNPTLYFDPGSGAPFRTAVFREVGAVGANPRYLWWDLVTGVARTSPFPYLHSTGFVEFAPSGTMAMVQHDVNGPGGSNYSLVVLCPAQIGEASQPGAEFSGLLHAWVLPGSPPTVQFREADDVTPHGGGPYADCTLPIGACCKSDGTCENSTEAGCVGIWHQEGTCSQVGCPTATLAVSMTGPASAERGAQVTCTLTARNTGLLASSGVVVLDQIPFGSTFVSASAGGTFSAATSRVTWNLGTLGAGQQTNLTVTVQAPCGGGSMTNLTYSIAGSPGGTVAGTPAVTTLLTAPNTAGLTLTLLSAALDPTPLQTGGRVRHTIRMANTTAVARAGLSFNVNSGAASNMLAVVNDGGGTATLGTTTLAWSGSLPASSTIDVIYDTAIRECRSAQPAVEALNNGAAVFVRNPCSVSLMFALPTLSFAVAPSPFSIQFESSSHGPVQWWGVANTNRMIACRPGAAVDLDLWVINASGATGPSSNVALTLPAELAPASNPPFLGAPPAGTTWDAGLKRIAWTGQVPANDTLVISFRVVMSGTACSADLAAIGGYSSCVNALYTSLGVLAVPVPPPNHLLALHGFDGLWFLDSAASPAWQPLLCGAFESLRGFGITPDSTIWVAGIPNLKLNPYHLSFEILPPSFQTALGMDWTYDAAGDPRDSTVVFGGYLSGFGLRVRRYNPRTQQVSVILNDTSPQTLGIARFVTVSNDGLIGVNTNSGVLRVDPANPGAYQLFTPPGGGSISGLTIDTDGHWITCGRPASAGTPRTLENVDRQTGVYTPIVDLQSHFNWFVDLPGITTTPSRDVFLSSADAVFAGVQRSGGNTVVTSIVPVTIVDLMCTGSVTLGVEPPVADGAPGALALSSPSPNPARAEVSLRFVMPATGRATLAVYDVGGRRVRALVDDVRPAGAHTIMWDGTADSGARVGAGLYFVRLHTMEGARIAKLVLAR